MKITETMVLVERSRVYIFRFATILLVYWSDLRRRMDLNAFYSDKSEAMAEDQLSGRP